MIQHFRLLAPASPYSLVGDLLAFVAPPDEGEHDAEPDETFDVLVKHAMRAAAPSAPNTERIWRQLSRRVVGPFGRLAVEGPGLSAVEGLLMKSGGGYEANPFELAARVSSGSTAATARAAPAYELKSIDSPRIP